MLLKNIYYGPAPSIWRDRQDDNLRYGLWVHSMLLKNIYYGPAPRIWRDRQDDSNMLLRIRKWGQGCFIRDYFLKLGNKNSGHE